MTLDPGWEKFGSGINIPDPQHCFWDIQKFKSHYKKTFPLGQQHIVRLFLPALFICIKQRLYLIASLLSAPANPPDPTAQRRDRLPEAETRAKTLPRAAAARQMCHPPLSHPRTHRPQRIPRSLIHRSLRVGRRRPLWPRRSSLRSRKP